MTTTTRAWKDPVYRMSLGAAYGRLPAHPAGAIELDDTMLANIRGNALGAATVTQDASQTAPVCSVDSC